MEDFLSGIFFGTVMAFGIMSLVIGSLVIPDATETGACAERGGAIEGNVCLVDNRVVELKYKDNL